MIEAQRENLNVNKLIAEKKEIIFVEGDMIVPDSKPDILNTICTSGVVSIYKKEAQEGKVRLDGSVNTYIMYMPDGGEDTVRGLNTCIDFSENINVSNCIDGMNVISDIKIKSIEAKVINGRKVGIKATLEVNLKIYSNEDVEIINEIQNENNVQILKEDLTVNSLVGQGTTKIYAKESIQLDVADNLAEILRAQVCLIDRDVKISYNKVLAKSEAEIRIMYLTEDNRICTVNYKIPVVGFIDIPNVTDGNLCDVNYEIKNIIIKPNSQEEHSIYVEIEIEVSCYVYEEKQLNLIQDMYSTIQNLNFEKKQIMTMTNKQCVTNIKQIREKINFNDIDGLNLVDVDIITNITNMYRMANINMIDSIEENGEREEQDYSIVIYIVKKGDTLWNIAKEFGSTVDSIARVNGIENRDLIQPGQKLYIPKFERISEGNYE